MNLKKQKMNIKPFTIVVAITLASVSCMAQSTQPAVIEDFKPSELNQPGQEYPQVNSQGYARFQNYCSLCGYCESKSWAWRPRRYIAYQSWRQLPGWVRQPGLWMKAFTITTLQLMVVYLMIPVQKIIMVPRGGRVVLKFLHTTRIFMR